MKWTLEFDMYEDQESFDIYRKAIDYHTALREFREWMKRAMDISPPIKLPTVQDRFFEILNDNEVEDI